MRSNRFRHVAAARGRVPRVVSCLCLGAAGLGVAGVADLATGVMPVGASTSTSSSPTTLSGTQDLASADVSASSAGVTATFDLAETLSWKQPARVTTTYDPYHLRQGRSPAARNAYAPEGAGTMTVSWTLGNLNVTAGGLGTIPLGSPSFSASGPCTLVVGAPYDCTVESGTTALIPTPDGFHGRYVSLALTADVTVTPQQLTALRTLVVGGASGTPGRVLIGETPATDSFALPCSDHAGEGISYDLGSLSATDGLSVLDSLAVDVGTADPSPTTGAEVLTPDAHASLSPAALAGSIDLSGQGADATLGDLLANNVAPKIFTGGPYSGTEGTPVAFDASASKDVCGAPTLAWAFSDGGTASGASPQHTFESAGLYDVRVTATDAAGLSSSTTFTVPIAALTPLATASSEQTTEWGLPVPFIGTASESGAAVQPLLADSWTFGDGSGGDGATVTHEYAMPGAYTATMRSCDPSARCGAATTQVTVTKRGTTDAYTGATASDVGGVVTFAASVLDDLGDPVPGVAVDFYADGSSTPFTSAVTNSMGLAFANSGFPRDALGSHTVTARFAGDSLYTGSSYGPVPYTLQAATSSANASGSVESDAAAAHGSTTRLGTTIAYTGATASAVTGRVVYAASVLDNLGDPVAGGVVDFYADASSTPFTSAVTNSMGFAFATTSFPRGTVGSHTVTARFDGNGRYTGSSYGPLPYTVYQVASLRMPEAKLGTTISYTGATASAVTGNVIYAASVLDDLGDPVGHALVVFYADGSTTPFASAVTNSMGFAFATSGFPGGATTIHSVTARFAGNPQYTGSSYGPVPYTIYVDGSP